MANVGLDENKPVWGDAMTARESVPRFARLTTTIDADVCVIGLGGSGLACIVELLEAGIPADRIVGLDAGVVVSIGRRLR